MERSPAPLLRPPVTGTVHVLPFEKLSPDTFERLCGRLIRKEGYESIQLLGPSGNDRGRDIVASRFGSRTAFQCKRVRSFEPQDAIAEIKKIRSLPEREQPNELIFLVTCNISDQTRRKARQAWGSEETCSFWDLANLDEKVKSAADILRDFFQLGPRTALLADYLEALKDYCHQYTYSTLSGINLPQLKTVYIAQEIQSLATAPNQAEGAPKARTGNARPAVDRTQRLIIEGGAGIGKSSLLNDLTLGYIDDIATGRSEALPVRTTARNLINQEVSFSESLYAAATKELSGRLRDRLPPDFFLDRPVVIMIDGVDEVLSLTQQIHLFQILAFHARRSTPDDRFVVTTRPGTVSTIFAEAGFHRYSLKPFKSIDIRTFAEKWFNRRSDIPTEDVDRLLLRIRASRISKLVEIPLLLTMATIIYENDRSRPLPTRRAGIYDRFVRILMDDEEAVRGTRMQFRSEWDRLLGQEGEAIGDRLFSGRRLILEHIAKAQVEGSQLPIPEEARVYAKNIDLTPPVADEEWLKRQLGILVKRTGLVIDSGTEMTFSHSSFRDFLAAFFYYRQSSQEEARLLGIMNSALGDPLWREIALFLLSIKSEHGQPTDMFLRQLLCAGEEGTLLAGEALADNAIVEPALQHAVIESLRYNMPRMGADTVSVLKPPNPISVLGRLHNCAAACETLEELGFKLELHPMQRWRIGLELKDLGLTPSALRIFRDIASAPPEESLFAVTSLHEMGASDLLLDVLCDRSVDSVIRMLAAQHAGELGRGDEVFRVATLGSMDDTGRKAAISALNLLGRDKDLELLTRRKDIHKDLCLALAEVLEKFRKVEVLTRIAQDRKSTNNARIAAGLALKNLGCLDVIKALAKNKATPREVALFFAFLAGATDLPSLQNAVGPGRKILGRKVTGRPFFQGKGGKRPKRR